MSHLYFLSIALGLLYVLSLRDLYVVSTPDGWRLCLVFRKSAPYVIQGGFDVLVTS